MPPWAIDRDEEPTRDETIQARREQAYWRQFVELPILPDGWQVMGWNGHLSASFVSLHSSTRMEMPGDVAEAILDLHPMARGWAWFDCCWADPRNGE